MAWHPDLLKFGQKWKGQRSFQGSFQRLLHPLDGNEVMGIFALCIFAFAFKEERRWKSLGCKNYCFFMEFRGSWMFCSCSFFENCLIVWITENGMVIFCSKLEDLFERFRTALLETIGSLCLEESPRTPKFLSDQEHLPHVGVGQDGDVAHHNTPQKLTVRTFQEAET